MRLPDSEVYSTAIYTVIKGIITQLFIFRQRIQVFVAGTTVGNIKDTVKMHKPLRYFSVTKV